MIVSWDDIMRRVLPPINGVQPHITGPAGIFGAGEAEGRRPPSKIPHPGADFNYVGGQTSGLNQSHPALHSPVDGIVENAGQGTVGRIAIRDKNGFLHETLHSATRHVTIGDPVAAGQIIGTMGNTGVRDQHVHYQLKNPAGEVINPMEFFDRQGPIDANPASPPYLDQSRRAAEILSGLDETSPLNRAPPPDRPGNPFFNPFNQTTPAPVVVIPPPVLNNQNPVADRSGNWGSVPLPNTPAASEDPASFNGRYGNWASWPAGVLGNFNAPPLHAPDLGKRSEADDAPVRVLSSRVVNASPASGDAPPVVPSASPPALGIFSGKPMLDYPAWPAIFAADDRSSPDDDELFQRWRRWLDA